MGICDKSSTRLHAPPGGKTSINLFGGEAPPATAPRPPAQTAAPAKSSVAAGQRVVQQTEHMGMCDKSSTRLHAPPGGKSSINIFSHA